MPCGIGPFFVAGLRRSPFACIVCAMSADEPPVDLEAMFPSRTRRIVLLVAFVVPSLAIIGLGVLTALNPDTTFMLGERDGRGIEISREVGLAIFLPVYLLLFILMAGMLLRGVFSIWSVGPADAALAILQGGESTLWRGKPGWRSWVRERMVATGIVVAVLALFGWWIWSAWNSDERIVEKLILCVLPVLFFCSCIVPVLVTASAPGMDWLCDAFGAIVITESRIVWLTPHGGQIYREIAGVDIVDAVLVQTDGRRGTVSVIRRVADDVEFVDLSGLPDPERALLALQRLASYQGD